jgi:hypothetical protein
MLVSIGWQNFTKTTWTFLATTVAAMLVPLPMTSQSRAEYCAFEVVVNSPDSKPVAGTEVAVTRGGRALGTGLTNEAGIARICDAPAGALLDVEVGGRLCGAVAVRYLSAYWLKTRRVYVNYSNCQGEEFAAPGGCEYTIRTRNEGGAALSGVVFDERQRRAGSVEQPAPVSDRYGRIFRFLGYGGSFTARLEKPGYAPRVLTGDCPVGADPLRDVIVVLSKR